MDEDDGQIARELVPVDEAFMWKDDDEEGTGAKLGLEQKCKTHSKALSCVRIKETAFQVLIRPGLRNAGVAQCASVKIKGLED